MLFRSPWYMFPDIAAVQDLSWKEMQDLLRTKGIEESHMELSLSTLMDMLDGGECVFCLVNDFALAEEDAGDLPGLSGNTLLWVSGVDLSDYSSASVCIAPLGAQSEMVPLDRFLKAWEKGNRWALSLQMEG